MTCHQASIDSLTTTASVHAAFAAAGFTCNPDKDDDKCQTEDGGGAERDVNDLSLCAQWGSPYLYNQQNYLNEGRCFFGDGSQTYQHARCEKDHDDGNHRRLCPCKSELFGNKYFGAPFEDCDGECEDMKLDNICKFMGFPGKRSEADDTQEKDSHTETIAHGGRFFAPQQDCDYEDILEMNGVTLCQKTSNGTQNLTTWASSTLKCKPPADEDSGTDLVLRAIRIKLFDSSRGGWDRMKPLSNCDCMLGECICRMVRSAASADASDFSLAEHSAEEAASESAGQAHEKSPGSCAMKFTWSQYDKITACECSGCTFVKQSTIFVARCSGGCECEEATTTQCVPGFFSISDKTELTDWATTGSFFEINMCTIRGRHSPAMCKKMRCEVFGDAGGSDDYCAGSSTWISSLAGNSSFVPAPAFCRILDVLKEAHFAHKFGIMSMTDVEQTAEVSNALYASLDEKTLEAIRDETERQAQFVNMGNPDPIEKAAKENLPPEQMEMIAKLEEEREHANALLHGVEMRLEECRNQCRWCWKKYRKSGNVKRGCDGIENGKDTCDENCASAADWEVKNTPELATVQLPLEIATAKVEPDHCVDVVGVCIPEGSQQYKDTCLNCGRLRTCSPECRECFRCKNCMEDQHGNSSQTRRRGGGETIHSIDECSPDAKNAAGEATPFLCASDQDPRSKDNDPGTLPIGACGGATPAPTPPKPPDDSCVDERTGEQLWKNEVCEVEKHADGTDVGRCVDGTDCSDCIGTKYECSRRLDGWGCAPGNGEGGCDSCYNGAWANDGMCDAYPNCPDKTDCSDCEYNEHRACDIEDRNNTCDTANDGVCDSGMVEAYYYYGGLKQGPCADYQDCNDCQGTGKDCTLPRGCGHHGKGECENVRMLEGHTCEWNEIGGNCRIKCNQFNYDENNCLNTEECKYDNNRDKCYMPHDPSECVLHGSRNGCNTNGKCEWTDTESGGHCRVRCDKMKGGDESRCLLGDNCEFVHGTGECREKVVCSGDEDGDVDTVPCSAKSNNAECKAAGCQYIKGSQAVGRGFCRFKCGSITKCECEKSGPELGFCTYDTSDGMCYNSDNSDVKPELCGEVTGFPCPPSLLETNSLQHKREPSGSARASVLAALKQHRAPVSRRMSLLQGRELDRSMSGKDGY
jgi:hypothetical protein